MIQIMRVVRVIKVATRWVHVTTCTRTHVHTYRYRPSSDTCSCTTCTENENEKWEVPGVRVYKVYKNYVRRYYVLLLPATSTRYVYTCIHTCMYMCVHECAHDCMCMGIFIYFELYNDFLRELLLVIKDCFCQRQCFILIWFWTLFATDFFMFHFACFGSFDTQCFFWTQRCIVFAHVSNFIFHFHSFV